MPLWDRWCRKLASPACLCHAGRVLLPLAREKRVRFRNRLKITMPTTMTSRERVRRALNHEETDRVPVDFGASHITGIAAIAYRNLLRHLGWQEDIRVYDVKQQLAQPSLALINRMGADVVQLNRLGPTSGMPFLRIDDWKPGCLTDGSPCLVPADLMETARPDGTLEIRRDGQLCAWRAPESFYFDVCYAPLAHAETTADIDAFVWPDRPLASA